LSHLKNDLQPIEMVEQTAVHLQNPVFLFVNSSETLTALKKKLPTYALRCTYSSNYHLGELRKKSDNFALVVQYWLLVCYSMFLYKYIYI
jgi:hypothetical protein